MTTAIEHQERQQDRAARLFGRLRMLGFRFNVHQPRYPEGAPDGLGGQWMDMSAALSAVGKLFDRKPARIRQGYQALNSVADVNTRLRIDLRATLKRPVQVDLGEHTNLTTAKEYAEGLMRVAERWPETRIDRVSVGKLPTGTYARVSRINRKGALVGITFSDERSRDRDKYLPRLKKGLADTGWPAEHGYAHVAAGAFGSAVDAFGGDRAHQRIDDAIGAHMDRTGVTQSDVDTAIRGQLGYTALRSRRDMVSAAVADDALHGPGASPLAKAVNAELSESYNETLNAGRRQDLLNTGSSKPPRPTAALDNLDLATDRLSRDIIEALTVHGDSPESLVKMLRDEDGIDETVARAYVAEILDLLRHRGQAVDTRRHDFAKAFAGKRLDALKTQAKEWGVPLAANGKALRKPELVDALAAEAVRRADRPSFDAQVKAALRSGTLLRPPRGKHSVEWNQAHNAVRTGKLTPAEAADRLADVVRGDLNELVDIRNTELPDSALNRDKQRHVERIEQAEQGIKSKYRLMHWLRKYDNDQGPPVPVAAPTAKKASAAKKIPAASSVRTSPPAESRSVQEKLTSLPDEDLRVLARHRGLDDRGSRGELVELLKANPGERTARSAPEFDPSLALTYPTLPVIRRATLVEAAPGAKTSITAPWGAVASFKGSWAKIEEPGDPSKFYGSALEEFLDMHDRVAGELNGWRKTAPVDAYPYTGPDMLVRTVLADGTVETENTAHDGDWLVRQVNGEVQVVRDAKFKMLYDATKPRFPKRRPPAAKKAGTPKVMTIKAAEKLTLVDAVHEFADLDDEAREQYREILAKVESGEWDRVKARRAALAAERYWLEESGLAIDMRDGDAADRYSEFAGRYESLADAILASASEVKTHKYSYPRGGAAPTPPAPLSSPARPEDPNGPRVNAVLKRIPDDAGLRGVAEAILSGGASPADMAEQLWSAAATLRANANAEFEADPRHVNRIRAKRAANFATKFELIAELILPSTSPRPGRSHMPAPVPLTREALAEHLLALRAYGEVLVALADELEPDEELAATQPAATPPGVVNVRAAQSVLRAFDGAMPGRDVDADPDSEPDPDEDDDEDDSQFDLLMRALDAYEGRLGNGERALRFNPKQPRWDAGIPGKGGKWRPTVGGIISNITKWQNGDRTTHPLDDFDHKTLTKVLKARLDPEKEKDLLERVPHMDRDETAKHLLEHLEAREAARQRPDTVDEDTWHILRSLAGGEKASITSDKLPALMDAIKTVKPATFNLSKLDVTGEGNEHLFTRHLSKQKRKTMPQLPTETGPDMDEFLAFLDSKGIKYAFGSIDPRKLVATQSELSGPKVAKLYGFMVADGWKEGGTLIMSRDEAVIDGHHRWAGSAVASVARGGTLKAQTLVLDLDWQDALDAVRPFAKTEDLTTDREGASA